MHDRIDLVLGKQSLEQCCVTRVADNQFSAGDGGLEAGAQVIQRDHLLTLFAQLADDMAADVSRTASNQYLLVFHEKIELLKQM